jgi:hypothetical protein
MMPKSPSSKLYTTSQFDRIVQEELIANRNESSKALSCERLKEIKLVNEPELEEKMIKKLLKKIKALTFHSDAAFDLVCTFCQENFEGDFQKESHQLMKIPLEDLEKIELQKAKELLKRFQSSGLLLNGVILKLHEIKECFSWLMHSMEKKSVWCVSFFDLLNDLTKSNRDNPLRQSPNLVVFMFIFDHELDEKMKDVLGKLIGKETFAVLRAWSLPEAVSNIIPTVSESLKHCISKVNITRQAHAWYQPIQCKLPLEKISAQEVVRSIMPDEVVLFDSITINGSSLFLKPGSKLSFFQNLIGKIESAITKSIPSEGEMQLNSELLIALSKIPFDNLSVLMKSEPIDWDKIRKLFFVSDDNFKTIWGHLIASFKEKELDAALFCSKVVPVINYLRLATNSCWGHAHSFIRSRYPNLFSCFIYARTVSETGLDIQVSNEANYVVTQEKCYAIYRKLKPYDPDDFAIDASNMLAKLVFRWEVSPHKTLKWKGVLKISQLLMNPLCDRQTKEMIYNSLIHFQNTDIDEIATNKTPPSTPKTTPKSGSAISSGKGSRLSVGPIILGQTIKKNY